MTLRAGSADGEESNDGKHDGEDGGDTNEPPGHLSSTQPGPASYGVSCVTVRQGRFG